MKKWGQHFVGSACACVGVWCLKVLGGLLLVGEVVFNCSLVPWEPFPQNSPLQDPMDLAYMCVKPQMRFYVCHQMRLYVCHQMRLYVCHEFATELASLARFFNSLK